MYMCITLTSKSVYTHKSQTLPCLPFPFVLCTPPRPSQTETCGGYDTFSLYKLQPLMVDECLRETPVMPYEQVGGCAFRVRHGVCGCGCWSASSLPRENQQRPRGLRMLDVGTDAIRACMYTAIPRQNGPPQEHPMQCK